MIAVDVGEGSFVFQRGQNREMSAALFQDRCFKMHPLAAVAVVTMLAMSTIAVGAGIPSNARSSAVVARVEPKLKEALAKKNLQLGSPVFIRIFKEPGILEMWVKKKKEFQLFRAYDICAFSGGLGPKLKEGDRQAPEGCYFVTPERMNPNSQYHLSFNLGYPNTFDRHHGRTGSALMVHGSCVSIGCYAMGDEAIEEIWTICVRAMENGQSFFRVHCFPFPLTQTNLERHKNNTCIDFWRDLQPIYDHFETKRVPPNVVVRNGRYTISETTE